MMRLRWLPIVALAWTTVHAHRLPLRAYTIADGLARDNVRCVVPDSLGFLWFCTDEGLSRFDGTTFWNFGRAEGLPTNYVRAFLESEPGLYWVGTDQGLWRFDPKPGRGPSRFARVPAAEPGRSPTLVSRVFRDASGRIWVAAREGAFVLEDGALRHVPFEGPYPATPTRDFAEDGGGGVWIAARYVGLLHVAPGDTRATVVLLESNFPGDIRALARTPEGDLWVGTFTGLFRVRTGANGSATVDLRLDRTDGLPEDAVSSLTFTRGGRLLAGASTGLGLVDDLGAPRPTIRAWTSADGLRPSWIVAAAEDVSGDLWLASLGGGVYRVPHEGFTSFDTRDGLSRGRPTAILPSADGRPCSAVRLPPARVVVSCFDGTAFVAGDLALPADLDNAGWGFPQMALARDGRAWLATSRGLFRFDVAGDLSAAVGARPARRYTTADGLPGDDVLSVFADVGEDLWVSAVPEAPEDGFLARFDRTTDRFEKVPLSGGIPRAALADFVADGRGGSWFLFENGSVARRREGRFLEIDPGEVPADVQVLFADSAGRVWLLGGAVSRVEDPAAEAPKAEAVPVPEGLSSAEVRCAVEDRFGRIWLGTGRGVDRFDPASGTVRRFRTADGLADNEVLRCLRDVEGDLWFATDGALSRIRPGASEPSPPPRVRLGEIRVAGLPLPISEVGESALEGIVLQPGQRSLTLRLIGLGASPGERLRFQHRIGAGPWSPPQDAAEIVLAGLAPGSYRVEARAVDADGVASPVPAMVAFEVRAPLWKRPWFVALLAACVAGAAYAAYRLRLARLVAVERIRRRIAMDLHDEVGSGLSQIALWSEVLRDDVEHGREADGAWLRRISTTSGELVDALGDVVWSIDPRRDRLGDLVHRMRRFLEESALGRGVAYSFAAPDGHGSMDLPPEPRRHLWLTFKEGVHNALKHAGASKIDVSLAFAGSALELTVSDDGTGFDPAADHAGTGLTSLRRRAAETGGRITIDSSPGSGTTIRLRLPLR